MVDPVPVTEKGYQTASRWWASIDEEDNPDLVWPKSVFIYDQMRRQDPQVMSVIRAVTLPIRRATFAIDGTGCKASVTKMIADDLGLPIKGKEQKASLRTRDRFSWPDHLRHALLELVFGHSYFEQVYRIDDQGYARLRKLAWRPPRTIANVLVDTDGGLISIQQHNEGQGGAIIAADRLVAYINDREGGNWLGQSLLRPAYKPWLLKDRALRVQAMTVDRNGLGVPVYTAPAAPATMEKDEAEAWVQTQLAAGLELVKGWRSGETAGAAVPQGGKIELLGVTGKLPDASPVIQYYDEQIARSVLAHFLNLGTQTGSWALGSTFADFFVLSLQSLADHIVDVTNAHVIEDLVDLNFGENEPAPRLVVEEIGSRSPITAEAIYQLVNCKAITPDEGLEQHLRSIYGLPTLDPNTIKETTSGPDQTPPGAQPGADPAADPVVPDPGQG